MALQDINIALQCEVVTMKCPTFCFSAGVRAIYRAVCTLQCSLFSLHSVGCAVQSAKGRNGLGPPLLTSTLVSQLLKLITPHPPTHSLPSHTPKQTLCPYMLCRVPVPLHYGVALLHAQHSHPVGSTEVNCSPKCAQNSSPIHTSRVVLTMTVC